MPTNMIRVIVTLSVLVLVLIPSRGVYLEIRYLFRLNSQNYPPLPPSQRHDIRLYFFRLTSFSLLFLLPPTRLVADPIRLRLRLAARPTCPAAGGPDPR